MLMIEQLTYNRRVAIAIADRDLSHEKGLNEGTLHAETLPGVHNIVIIHNYAPNQQINY